MSLTEGIFPPGFLFGTSTSSYQVEGAWNEGGKSESFWDRLVHEKPHIVKDGRSGDEAADSYHKYKEDVQLVKKMGLDYYRFSLSWCRILPEGDLGVINREGIDYYNSLINELLANNVQPMITLYHWDLPQILQDLGGWFNPLMAKYFEDYARICFQEFGDRVKWWITLNDPHAQGETYCHEAMCCFNSLAGRGEYLAVHHMLLAHAKAYRLYEKEFESRFKGKIGITISCPWHTEKTPNPEDIEAAQLSRQFNIGWIAHPIFSKSGDYPPIMRQIVDENSKREGRSSSRLPLFTKEEIELVQGSSDFFGVNHYVTALASKSSKNLINKDIEVTLTHDPRWIPTSMADMFVTPWGLREVLKWINLQYGNPKVLITENGCGDKGEIVDLGRIDYFGKYLNEILKAIYLDGCHVVGYTAWTLLDNFEWVFGYTVKFGLHSVDFRSENKTRTSKASSAFLAMLTKNKRLPPKYLVAGDR